ncbi:MAG: STAS domain-containing protein [Bacteroidetes bacterium]|nr:STAS domain-containing protein [Bacteroidota bacterium]
MEELLETEPSLDLNTDFQDFISQFSKVEKKNITSIKTIHSFADEFIVKENPVHYEDFFREYPASKLAGVYLQGIQYYDLVNITFIDNTGIANLIELLKSLLKEGVEVRFVNVNENIKNKIKSMDLDHILNCD